MTRIDERQMAAICRGVVAGARRRCVACRQSFLLGEFHSNSSRPSASRCQDCQDQVRRRRELAKSTPTRQRLALRQARKDALARGNWICSVCERERPRNEFPPHTSRKLGHKSYCLDCEKERRRDRVLKQYGITAREFDRLLGGQDGRCGICRKPSGRRLNVDHCHVDGPVRGLLDRVCNTAIGMLGDCACGVSRAYYYLLRFELGTTDVDMMLRTVEQHLRAAAKELDHV